MTSVVTALLASGPVAVFLLFLSPIGPGAIAGIVLARSQGMPAALTIGLYVLSDVVMAVVLNPLLVRFRGWAGRSRFGQRYLQTLNQVASMTQVVAGRYGEPLGVYTCTFATDFYTAALISTGLSLHRLIAWIAIIAGDVTWFLIVFFATASVAAFLTDNRIVFVVSLVLGFGLPWLIRRLVGTGRVPATDLQSRPVPPRSQPTDEAALRQSPAHPGSTEPDRGER